MTLKFGRLPRTFDTRIPQMATLRARQPAPPPLPPNVEYGSGMPGDLGMMLNDNLGDCVEAAAGHAIQTWSFNADRSMITPPDSAIEKFYEIAGGYVPGNPNTDNGTIIQVALADWLNDPVDNNTLTAFVEVDVVNLAEVKRTIWECGLIYIGFNVPAFLQNNLEGAGSVWDVDPSGDNSIFGGHCVVLTGYDATGNMTLISWGSFYTMTPAFWAQFVDECYALANPSWFMATGQTPAGLSLAQLEALMQSLKGGLASPRRRHRHHRRMKRRTKV
jgi:hypothetical protein